MPYADAIAREFWREHKICGVCERDLTYRDVVWIESESAALMAHDKCVPQDVVRLDPLLFSSSTLFRLPRNYVEESPGLDSLRQLEPQKARAFKDLEPEAQDFLWDSPRYWAERKYDGVRMLLHFTDNGIRMTSRRVSKKSNRYHEPTDNFPHIRDVKFSEKLIGTVLDAEIIIEKEIDTGATQTKGYLAGTVAVSNSGPEKAVWIQRKNDAWAHCYLFDILFLANNDVRSHTQQKRREILEKIFEKVFGQGLPWFKLAEIAKEGKQEFYSKIVEDGGEGVMLKDATKPYVGEGRPAHWFKVKKATTIDAIITGFIPGEKGYEGLVGAFEVSVYDDRGVLVPIAAVSQMTLILRREISHQDEKGGLILDPTQYGRVVEVVFQELTKTGRGRHAVLIGFRDDKNPKDCTIEQVQ